MEHFSYRQAQRYETLQFIHIYNLTKSNRYKSIKSSFRSIRARSISKLFVNHSACCNTLAATSNPLGTKCGEVSYPVFLSCIAFNGDASIQTAAKKAGITRISHIDVKKTSILGIYGTYTVYVWGE